MNRIRQYQIIKWTAAGLFVVAYILMHYTSTLAQRRGLGWELEHLWAIRTTIITVLFCTTMWAMSHILHDAKAGKCGRK